MTRRRAAHLEVDLRGLLGLPPPPPADTARTATIPWCARLREFGRQLLPETAEAQGQAQDSATPARLRRQRDERVKPPPTRGANGREATPLPRQRPRPPVGQEFEGVRHVPLTSWVDVANNAENIRAARRTADGLLVEIHKKYAITVACLVFVLVGIPLALRFPRGGMGLVLGGGLGIFALYYISLTAGEPLADAGIVPPAVVMWAPNVVFTVVGVVGLLRVNRELGSTRGGDIAELADLFRRRVARWRRR